MTRRCHRRGSLALLAAWGLAICPAAHALETRAELGPVSASVRIEPDAPVIGDPMQLTIEALAEEGVEVLMPEFGEALDRFPIVDFVPRESLDSEGRTLFTQRYQLEAPLSGQHAVPAILIEFVDHRSDDFYRDAIHIVFGARDAVAAAFSAAAFAADGGQRIAIKLWVGKARHRAAGEVEDVEEELVVEVDVVDDEPVDMVAEGILTRGDLVVSGSARCCETPIANTAESWGSIKATYR